jgi:squalene-hopene/tetraprenyl-beta-curcumene cyclase
MAETASLSKEAPAAVGSSSTSVVKKAFAYLGLALLLLVLLGAYLFFFETPSHSKPTEAMKAITPSGDPILDCIHKGAEYLRVHQEPDGHFSRGFLDPKPAFTALIVDALARSPDKYRSNTPFVKKAVDAILATQQKDGALYTPDRCIGMETYCTSISIMALTALEDPAYAQNIERARDFLRTTQIDDYENPNNGGAAYSKGGRPSGDVTQNWIEAMRAAGVKPDDPAMKNAKAFFDRLQNNPEVNTGKQPDGMAVGSDGGAIYRIGESKAGFDIKDGKKIPKSYGLMSYASLKSFLHLNVPKDDPRVTGAMRWVRDNYTLEENRNIGPRGLFYYYLTMAKALSLYGETEIKTADGQTHNWAKELSEKLIQLQAPDGSWHNTQSSEWMENDNVLVSGFAIRTLSLCYEQLHKDTK